MNQPKIGALIRDIRVELQMTQRQLAQAIGVSNQAVSKWERGLGCPDVSLLRSLSHVLGVPVEGLLSGDLTENEFTGVTMKQLRFYVCPQCGNLLTATGEATLSCCGRTLSPLEHHKPDEAHTLSLESIEDEWYITIDHPMTKEHHISFVALVTGERVTLTKKWPEWDFQLRLPKKDHGLLYWYCTQHGLSRQII